MSAAQLKGAMIGAGYFAGHQGEAWTRIPEAKIVAVADPAPGRAVEFAKRWNIARAYTDAATMLERERPDFVDIVTRPETHLELVSLAARHRAHILCQKPMAPSWQESVAMVKACEDAGVRLLMHENWRWQPWHRQIRRLLDADALGKPFHISFRMRMGDGRGPQPYGLQPYFLQMEKLLVYEVLVHFLDGFRFFLGEFSSVFCQTARVNPVPRAEDYAIVQVRFAQGAHGLIDANRFSGPELSEITLGTLHLEGERAQVRLSPDGRLWFTEYGHDEKPHEYAIPTIGYRGDCVRATQQHAIDSLKSGSPSETEGADYLKSVAAVFACYHSAAIGASVSPKEWIQAQQTDQ